MLAALNPGLRRLPPGAVYVLGLLPLGWIVWLVVSNGLGPDPVKEIEHRLGKVALWFLLGGLAVTPALRLLRLNLIRYRRALGLLSFLYAMLHLGVWLVLDMRLLWGQALGDLVKRPYLLLGLSALALLVVLALSSNDPAQRRLGAWWRRLHRLVYAAAALAVAHYLWQMKVISTEGWVWAAALAGLLALRLPWVTRRRGT